MFAKHMCTVFYGSESCLPPLQENATFLERFCRMFHKAILVSPTNPMCKIYFKSKAAITQERKRHVEAKLLYIIHPLSRFRLYWKLWMMMVFLGALIFHPFHVAFCFITNRFSVYVNILNFFCLVDIVVRFFTGYGIKANKEVVLEPGKIARKYLCSYFIMDILSSIPPRFIKNIFESTIKMSDVTWHLIDNLLLLKIFRFCTLFNYMNRANDLWQTSLLYYLGIRYAVMVFLILHWTACMHFAIPMSIGMLTGKLSPQSWIVKSGLNKETSQYNRYIRCIFRASCYLLSVTFGEHQPTTVDDILLAIFSFLAGLILSALLLVLVLEIFSSVVSAETKYQEIMNQVQEYMGYKQLPITMQRRLIVFYEYRFQKSYFREGVITATLSERLKREINVFCYRQLVDSVTIFKDVPQHIVVDIVNSLKSEIFLPNDIIVKAGTIGDCMYFLASGTVAVVTPTGREIFIEWKVNVKRKRRLLQQQFTEPNAQKPLTDVEKRLIYFMSKNQLGDATRLNSSDLEISADVKVVGMEFETDYNKRIIETQSVDPIELVCHLYDGAYFGEIALVMKDQKRIANVVAIEICQVYRLDRKSFKTCFMANIELFKKVEKIAQERREKTSVLEELHKKYLMAMEMPNMWGLEPT